MTLLSNHTPRPAQGRFGPFGADPSVRSHGLKPDFARPQLERLAHASLRSADAVLALIDGWRSDGHDLEDIYIRGIAPCARLLGEWWTSDTADFAQVTIASAHLQRALHRLSQEFCAPGAEHPTGLNLLLATEPQSQHTMGAFMLGEFFRRRGWKVQLLAPQDGEEVLGHLRRDWFDAVALSISTERHLHRLRDLLRRLRSDAPNPAMSVLVGGGWVLSHPEAFEALGVDLVGGDARQTVQAFSLMAIARRN